MRKKQYKKKMVDGWFSPVTDEGPGSKARIGHLLAPRKNGEKPRPLQLYRWQIEALEKWEKEGWRGVVEAVTGSGKTCFAIAAIADLAYAQGGYRDFHPLVVVPTKVLMHQWATALKQVIPDIRVGKIDGTHKDTFANCDICVGVINSVLKRLDLLFDHTKINPKSRTLLVADECHRYIKGPVFSKIRAYNFNYTLAISATVYTAADSIFVEGLGRIFYDYGFEQAGKDGLVPPFDLVNCEVKFTTEESIEYYELTKSIKGLFKMVYKIYPWLMGLPLDVLFAQINELRTGRDETDENSILIALQCLLFKRAALTYLAQNKLTLTTELVRLMLERGNKVLIFFERIQSAEDAKDIALEACRRVSYPLKKSGHWCKTYHSEMHDKNREKVLREFKKPGAKALFSCRSLDEGLDVPEVDCSILAASTKSKRQRIQRVGRVLRRGDGGKRSLIVTLYIPGTGDAEVSEEDHHTFGGPVRIHGTDASLCMELVGKLLART